jgi:EAL domain-containing protein (putative c-di-GMP-specific phosphodiesterase class I)
VSNSEKFYTPQSFIRRSVRLAPKLALAATACAIFGLGVFGFGWGLDLFPGVNIPTLPLNSAALVLIGIAAFRLRPHGPVWPTYGLALIAVLLASSKLIVVLAGWVTGTTTFNNTLMVVLLALALVLVARRRIVAGQFIAFLSMLPPAVVLIGMLYSSPSYDGTVIVIVFASGLLSAASILCGTAYRGPMRHFLSPDPGGKLQRIRLTTLTGATVGLGFIGVRLDFHPDVVPLLVTALVAIIIVMMTDISGYRGRVADKKVDPLVSDDLPPLASKIRDALGRGEFSLHFQPQVDLSTNRTVGMEALARWHDPEDGMISPAMFIPAAEASGLIVPLGCWVLESACEQGMRWNSTPLAGIDISVNVSPLQFKSPGFVDSVQDILRRTGFPPGRLILELTESALVRRGEQGFQALWALHELGLKISIDDFGTGYSCLAYLHDLPVNYLKIDQSFVQRLPFRESDVVIARSIVGLGRGLGLSIVAEGVETTEQADFLKGIWCDKAQGYLYSRPLDADGALAWAMSTSARNAVLDRLG